MSDAADLIGEADRTNRALNSLILNAWEMGATSIPMHVIEAAQENRSLLLGEVIEAAEALGMGTAALVALVK